MEVTVLCVTQVSFNVDRIQNYFLAPKIVQTVPLKPLEQPLKTFNLEELEREHDQVWHTGSEQNH